MTKMLNQVVAIEKGVKNRANDKITEALRVLQKADNFAGMNREYRRINDEGEELPGESKVVAAQVPVILAEVAASETEILDITAQKDYGNCNAFADVVVDGTTILKQAPATYLLYLEKKLEDYRKLIATAPVLDASDRWSVDDGSGLYYSETKSTHRTKKVQKPLVLYPATPEHPAQTQLVTEDVLVGYWDTTGYSGAIPLRRREELEKRVEALIKAVKAAREEANTAVCQPVPVGSLLFGYLLA